MNDTRQHRTRRPAGTRRARGFSSLALLAPAALLAAAAGCGPHNANADPVIGGEPGGTSSGAGRSAATQTAGGDDAPQEVPVFGYEVVERFDHDPRAYTQGLVFADGRLLESTGRRGTSWLREVRLETGKPVRQLDLDYRYFGEGLALHGDELFQLTWQSGDVFVYDRHSFERKRVHRLAGEGWGAASDGEHLVVSDGTATLRFFDPASFEELRRVEVTYGDRPVDQLNELEVVEGELFANVWKQDAIARIDLETGHVIGWIDLRGLMDFPRPRDTDAVLNGIAYDAKKKRLFVTGKLWPRLYEIRLVERG